MDLDEPQSPTPVEEMQKSEKAATFVEHAPTKGKRGRPKGVPSAPRPKKPATASGAASTPGTSAFPISRVAKIVKADKEIAMCQKEAIFLMSVATVCSVMDGHETRLDALEQEHFIKRLSDAAYTNSRMDQSKQIRYKDLGGSARRNAHIRPVERVYPCSHGVCSRKWRCTRGLLLSRR